MYKTVRMLLRRLTVDDAEHLFELDSDPEVMRHIGPLGLADVAAYRKRIVDDFLPIYDEHPGLGLFAACDVGTGEFLGWFHLTPALGYRFSHQADYLPGDVDLGYRLRRGFWGRGLATEGGRRLTEAALAELDAQRVVAVTLSTNLASIRVLENCGMRKDREFALPGYDTPALRFVRNRQS